MSQVYDCVMLHSEIDMCLLRMHILNDVVDKFVVVESKTTHSGKPKRLYFQDALDGGVFDEFKDKLIYAWIEKLDGANSWEREHANRAFIGEVLGYYAEPDDWVIVADVDEIPAPDVLRHMKQFDLLNYDAATLEMVLLYYNFAHRVELGWGIGMCRWSVCQDANAIRRGEFPAGTHKVKVPNAGWHLSYFQTPEQIITKLDAFMHHADVGKDVPRDAEWIAKRMAAGQDLFGRTVQITRVDPEPLLPQYIRDNRAKYEALGWLEAEREVTR
jgi:beta-1,4-mannosyl-glycoprotein beta-1,4-N-acetylglucosaminyltransferase